MDELPWVMLGIRTAPKEDLKASSAEMVFGAPLAVPGDLVSSGAPESPDTHLHKIRSAIQAFHPVPTSQHAEVSSYIPQALKQAQYVLIRR